MPSSTRGFTTPIWTLAWLLVAAAAIAQPTDPPPRERERPVYEVGRIDEEIRIDGRLDEAAWGGAPTFELLFETRPAENGPAPVETRVWIAYDVNNLYLAVRASDPDPSKIRARLSDRDTAYSDDFVGVALDTFDDQRRAFEFFVNPLGVQMDLTQNEVTGNEDDSWDAIWDSAGQITDFGYVVEIRIPFESLRFPSGREQMTWGIDAIRFYPRDQRYRLALNPLDRGNNCYLCQVSKLEGFAGVEPARSIELDPTFTSAMTGSRPDFPDGGIEDDDPTTDAGLTAHWGMTPNLTLSATVNPDFSQVEADVAQLDVNTQFALFFPEKRPFFLEGADLFDTRFQAMYSRNIADPAWGLKLTGKMGKDAVGAIVARDERTNFLIPGSQGSRLATLDEENTSTMLRYRRDLFRATTGGFFYTGREGDDFHNRVLGGDILFRWRDYEALRVEILGSQSLYPGEIAAAAGQPTGEISDHALRVVYQHTDRNWMYYALYRDVGEDFRADLGFVPRADFNEREVALERGWYPEVKGWSQVRVGVNANDVEDQAGRHLERRVDLYTWAQGARGSFVRLGVLSADTAFQGEIFDTDRVSAYGEIQVLPSVYIYSEAITGKQVDYANARQADRVRFDPGARFNLGRHLRLNLDHSYEALDVEGGRLFTANLTQLRATYQFNVRTFVRWVGQFLDVDRDPALYLDEIAANDQNLFNQLLFSYKVNPKTVLFLGYSDSYFGDDQIDLTQERRTLFFKVGYAFLL